MRKHLVTISGIEFHAIPSSTQRIKLININDDEMGSFENERFRFQFQVVGGEYDQCPIDCFVNINPSGKYAKNSKFVKIVKALTGADEMGTTLDVFALIGLECLGEITLEVGKKIIDRITLFKPIEGES